MSRVTITADANRELAALPVTIQRRVGDVVIRLKDWPTVSGAKALRGNLADHFRIRTGDYRIVFKPSADGSVIRIWKIGNRKDVYLD